MKDFEFTYHAQSRFRERFPELLLEYKSTRESMTRASQGATHERGFLNDSRRIVMMLDKYGDFNYDYYVKGKVVFVCRDTTVITVIHRDDSGMVNQFGPKSTPRFRKKQTCRT